MARRYSYVSVTRLSLRAPRVLGAGTLAGKLSRCRF